MKRILIADDDAVSRKLMTRMLQQAGFEVTTAADGREAVEILKGENGPRLVLLDWTMPELSGPEVCRAVRESPRAAYVYIMLLTSKDRKEDIVAGLEAGADDYLIKPCHPEELRARLRTGQRILELEDILVTAKEEMRLHATRDSLTQLFNRRAIFDKLASAYRKMLTGSLEFSLLLCDVDHFKRINDTYGHAVGDEVLREVAFRLQHSVFHGSVGRYGGEEFLLVCEDCGPDHVGIVANRICESVRTLPIETTAGLLNISISVGAVAVDGVEEFSAPERAMQRADELLYEAKRSGRNCAVVYARQPEIVSV